MTAAVVKLPEKESSQETNFEIFAVLFSQVLFPFPFQSQAVPFVLLVTFLPNSAESDKGMVLNRVTFKAKADLGDSSEEMGSYLV